VDLTRDKTWAADQRQALQTSSDLGGDGGGG
jgi:hypothetical protein